MEDMINSSAINQDPNRRNRKLPTLCLHKNKFLSSHPQCSAKAEMCSEKCSRQGHLQEDHQIFDADDFVANVKIQKEKNAELYKQYIEQLTTVQNEKKKNFEEILYKAYLEKKKKIQQILFDQNIVYLLEYIQVNKIHQLECGHIYDLRNMEPSKGGQINQIKKLMDQFKGQGYEGKKIDQIETKFTENLKKLKDQYIEKLDSERKQNLKKVKHLEEKAATLEKLLKQSMDKLDEYKYKLVEVNNQLEKSEKERINSVNEVKKMMQENKKNKFQIQKQKQELKKFLSKNNSFFPYGKDTTNNEKPQTLFSFSNGQTKATQASNTEKSKPHSPQPKLFSIYPTKTSQPSILSRGNQNKDNLAMDKGKSEFVPFVTRRQELKVDNKIERENKEQKKGFNSAIQNLPVSLFSDVFKSQRNEPTFLFQDKGKQVEKESKEKAKWQMSGEKEKTKTFDELKKKEIVRQRAEEGKQQGSGQGKGKEKILIKKEQSNKKKNKDMQFGLFDNDEQGEEIEQAGDDFIPTIIQAKGQEDQFHFKRHQKRKQQHINNCE